MQAFPLVAPPMENHDRRPHHQQRWTSKSHLPTVQNKTRDYITPCCQLLSHTVNLVNGLAANRTPNPHGDNLRYQDLVVQSDIRLIRPESNHHIHHLEHLERKMPALLRQQGPNSSTIDRPDTPRCCCASSSCCKLIMYMGVQPPLGCRFSFSFYLLQPGTPRFLL